MMRLTMICLAVAGLSLASIAQAAGPLVVVEEYSFHFGPNNELVPTNWDTSFDVPKYGGADLAQVMIILKGTAESDVSATATTSSPAEILLGEAGALISATSSDVNLLVDVLPNGTIAPPTVNIPGNTTVDILDVTGMDMDMQTIDDAIDLADYVGAGTFNVDVGAIGTLSTTTSGGNLSIDQSTAAGAWLTVQYKVMVPEPSALLIALPGLAALGRRRR